MRRATLLSARRHHRQRSRRAEAQSRTRDAVPERSRAHCRRRWLRPCFRSPRSAAIAHSTTQYLGKLGTLAAQPEAVLPLLERALVVQGSGSCQAHARVRDLTGGSHAGHGHRPGQHDGAPVEPGDDVGVRARRTGRRSLKNLGEFQGIPVHRRIRSEDSARSIAPAKCAASSRRTRSLRRSEALQQAIERIENCVALKERQSKPLASWIATNKQ